MPHIEWDSTLCVDIPEVDEQHKRLVAMLQSMKKAAQAKPTRDTVYAGILDMMEYASMHFRAEENLMKDYAEKVASYAEHMRQHREFMKITLEFLSRFREEGADLADEMCAFLYSWIANHIRVVDRVMSQELRDLGAL